MKIVAGLGNPGPEYDATRHNVGWWVVDHLAREWKMGPFRRRGPALVAEGAVGGEELVLLKPLTYMNRSGMALRPWVGREGFAVSRDLMVVVDDATRDVGGVRLRPGGSAGGHNGLRSIEDALGHQDYPRLRIGVGRPPAGGDLVDWVLSPMEPEEEDQVLALIREIPDALRVWIREGVQEAMNAINR